MQKYIIILLSIFTALFSSCTDQILIDENSGVGNGTGNGHTFGIYLNIGQNEANNKSRILFEDNGTTMKLAWDIGDKITMFNSDGANVGNFILNSTDIDKAKGYFQSDNITIDPSGDYSESEFTFVYPATDAQYLSMRNTQLQEMTQSGASATTQLAPTCFMSITGEGFELDTTSIPGITLLKPEEVLSMQMDGISLFALTLPVPDVAVFPANSSIQALKLSYGNLSQKVNLSGIDWSATTTPIIYVYLPSGAGQGDFVGLEMEFNNGGSPSIICSATKTNKIPLQNGMMYATTIESTSWYIPKKILWRQLDPSVGFNFQDLKDYETIIITDATITSEADVSFPAMMRIKEAICKATKPISFIFPNLTEYSFFGILGTSPYTKYGTILGGYERTNGVLIENDSNNYYSVTQNIYSLSFPALTKIGCGSFLCGNSAQLLHIPKLTEMTQASQENSSTYSEGCAFAYMNNLTSLELPLLTGDLPFRMLRNNSGLTYFSAPNVTGAKTGVFYDCIGLEEINLESITTIETAFVYVSSGKEANLSKMNLPKLSSYSAGTAGNECIQGTKNLNTLILGTSSSAAVNSTVNGLISQTLASNIDLYITEASGASINASTGKWAWLSWKNIYQVPTP